MPSCLLQWNRLTYEPTFTKQLFVCHHVSLFLFIILFFLELFLWLQRVKIDNCYLCSVSFYVLMCGAFAAAVGLDINEEKFQWNLHKIKEMGGYYGRVNLLTLHKDEYKLGKIVNDVVCHVTKYHVTEHLVLTLCPAHCRTDHLLRFEKGFESSYFDLAQQVLALTEQEASSNNSNGSTKMVSHTATVTYWALKVRAASYHNDIVFRIVFFCCSLRCCCCCCWETYPSYDLIVFRVTLVFIAPLSHGSHCRLTGQKV